MIYLLNILKNSKLIKKSDRGDSILIYLRIVGFEPTRPTWKVRIIPLNYIRYKKLNFFSKLI